MNIVKNKLYCRYVALNLISNVKSETMLAFNNNTSYITYSFFHNYMNFIFYIF